MFSDLQGQQPLPQPAPLPCEIGRPDRIRMPNNRLPKKLVFGEVKGLCPPGRPRSNCSNVALRDCQNCRISRAYRDAQHRMLGRDKPCVAHT